MLILITTNEEMDSLHEAISRPGRCASKIVFPRLSKDEAIEWAAANNLSFDVEGDMSLAELYGVAEGFSKTPEAPKRQLGFHHSESSEKKKVEPKRSIGFDVGSRPEPETVAGGDQTMYTEEVPIEPGLEEYVFDD